MAVLERGADFHLTRLQETRKVTVQLSGILTIFEGKMKASCSGMDDI